MSEGPGSKKVLFFRQIKTIEQRLNDPKISPNSFILSWTPYQDLNCDKTQEELENMNVLFMKGQQNCLY